jgi:hypothetical protein
MKQFLESNNLLQTVVDETEKTSDEATKLARWLSEEQLNWKPAPDRWSIAQCLEHLALTTEKFDPYFTLAIERGREKWPVSSAAKYRPSRLGGWLIKQLLPEAAKKVPAPKVFRPAETVAIEGALEHFLKAQTDFLGFVQRAEGLDYNKTKLRSPVTFLMRYSLADAFVITVVHGQRHLGQARRVRETQGFPG